LYILDLLSANLAIAYTIRLCQVDPSEALQVTWSASDRWPICDQMAQDVFGALDQHHFHEGTRDGDGASQSLPEVASYDSATTCYQRSCHTRAIPEHPSRVPGNTVQIKPWGPEPSVGTSARPRIQISNPQSNKSLGEHNTLLSRD
jgi:hypothetical protein